jgi:hypothetical protein
MDDAPQFKFTRPEMLETIVRLLEQMRDELDPVAQGLRALPEGSADLARRLQDLDLMGTTCWQLMQTYVSTMECEGNA